jgi:excisionase family DNA binding protein
MVNQDITVALGEEQVKALLTIADRQEVTLSALFRDIVASYMGEYAAVERAYQWAFRHFLKENHSLTDHQIGSTDQNEIHMLREEVATLKKIVTTHVTWHSLSPIAISSEHIMPTSLFEEQTQNSSDAVLSSVSSGVLQSEAPDVPFVDTTVLVKPTAPVAPVIEAPGYGSLQNIKDDKEYSVEEVSAYLGLSPATVRKYARDGRIPSRKVSRVYVFSGKDIRTYVITSSKAQG